MGINLDHPHVEVGDKGYALSDWRVEGADAENTDRGRLYLRLNAGTLELYSDREATQLVAAGPDPAPPLDAVLIPQNGSGLTVTVYRRPGTIGDGSTTGPQVVLYVWLCSERDLRENEDQLSGLLIDNETNLTAMLDKTMRQFLVFMSSIYPPGPCVGHPLRWAPPPVEEGKRGEQEWTSYFFWSLNSRGQHELVGMQNPDDYRDWAIQQTLANCYFRKARAGDPQDPWWTKYLASQAVADRLAGTLRPWVDIDRSGTPDRIPKIRTTRLRRG